MKYFISVLEFIVVLLLLIATTCGAKNLTDKTLVAHYVSSPVEEKKMPYVYSQWKHFTVEDGLPNDHIFAVKADASNVWN